MEGGGVLDFRELSYIIAIARQQSVTKAARELFVSQPALSKFVQNQEKELGQRLFKRLGNKFMLTYAGERYVEHARKILLIKKELDQELSDIVRENIGELKIAFPIMRGTYMLPCSLPMFREKFPLVNVTVREADSSVLEDMLLLGDIDLAFFNLPIKSPDVDYEIISHEEVVLIMPPEHPLANSGIPQKGCKYPWIDLSTLKNEGFILQRSDQRTRQITDKLFKEAGIKPNILLSVRNILASVKLAANGYGLTFVSETHLRHINLNVTPVRFSVGNPCTTAKFVAAFRKGIYLPHYTKEYIKIVKDFT